MELRGVLGGTTKVIELKSCIIFVWFLNNIRTRKMKQAWENKDKMTAAAGLMNA